MVDARGGGEPPRPDRRRRVAAFAGGIASGMAVIGLVWLLVSGGGSAGVGSGRADPGTWVTTSPAADGASRVHRATDGTASGSADDVSTDGLFAASSTPLDRCTSAADRLAGSLARAKAALDQWAVHVGAMNQLVVGNITLAQAQAFWNRTRVGAHRRIAHFDSATRVLAQDGVDCPDPALAGTRWSPALRACTRHVAALADELDAARTAITTWAHHVRAMEMLRAGRLSPDRATAMWLSMWRRGTAELARYRSAARAVHDTPGCDGSTTGFGSPWSSPDAPGTAGPGDTGGMGDMSGMGSMP
jgi:hypothetical protein